MPLQSPGEEAVASLLGTTQTPFWVGHSATRVTVWRGRGHRGSRPPRRSALTTGKKAQGGLVIDKVCWRPWAPAVQSRLAAACGEDAGVGDGSL